MRYALLEKKIVRNEAIIIKADTTKAMEDMISERDIWRVEITG